MKWQGWSKTPTRKPLAVYITGLSSFVILCYVFRGEDIPPVIARVIEGMFYGVVVGGYFGTSAFQDYIERTKKNPPSYEEEEKEEEPYTIEEIQ